MIERRPDGGTAAGTGPTVRCDLEVRGAVQGVGFRPFVYRAARELGLAGWVLNDVGGVRIRLEGAVEDVAAFRRLLRDRPPPRAVIDEVRERQGTLTGLRDFTIRHSDAAGTRRAFVLPDVATCPDCLAEILDPADRRHGYPFTNCTNCGPRFSIIRALPYDRTRTTMAGFRMCAECRAEYEDPLDRRFHAQPNACPECGPRLRLLGPDGASLATAAAALEEAASFLGRGRILALKGLGGYQLLVDARNDDAVRRLRTRKRRPTKPLACMVADLDAARRIAVVDPAEAELLRAPEAPIVLLRRRAGAPVADAVAPGRDRLGLMLPTTPLHHLLLRRLGFPVVATSGNLSDEPICIDDAEAVQRLREIADRFLAHDRPVERHVDDSVGWVVAGQPQLLRRARGWAPLPVRVRDGPAVLAVGAHQKNAVALAVATQAFLSQHIGDLDTLEATAAFERVVDDLLRLYEARPVAVAHDAHPDYASTRWALEATERGPLDGVPRVAVQHHHAHLAACLAEHGAEGPALGVVWDGTGHGPDGTVWGGEFLAGDAAGFRRLARLRPFPLAGGEAAVREPWRVAVALGAAAGVEPGLAAVPPDRRALVERMLDRGLRSPFTSSAGRLFDGVAAWLGLGDQVSYEGEAAVRLEQRARHSRGRAAYELPMLEGGDRLTEAGDAPELELDWRPMIAAIAADLSAGVEGAEIAGRFHRGLMAAIAAVAERLEARRLALTGGCFQNRLLLLGAAERLEGGGHAVLWPRLAPANDGGIALGQVAVARAWLDNDGLEQPEEG